MHSYYWDSENKNVQLDSSVTMTYDALGRWVERQTSSGYSQAIYSPDGREFAVMSGSSLVTAYVPLPQGALASYLSSGFYAYWHPDWLGTPRLYSSANQTVIADVAFSAFGQQYQGPSKDTFFQGSGQIVEANDLRTYPARNLSAVQGRWASPDPAGMAAVDLANPQSLNRYAFVLGNPLGLVDPSGMDCIKLDGGGTADDGAGNYTCPGSTDPDILNVFSDGTAIAVSFGAYYGTRNNSGVGSGGQQLTAPATNAPTISAALPAPWYKNSCITGALGITALKVGIDAIGLIPEAEGFTKVFENTAGYQLARAVGNSAGYRGVVATQYGMKVVPQVKGAVATVNGAFGLGDTTVEGRISTGLTIAGFIPGVGTGVAAVSIGLDLFTLVKAIGQCQ